MTGCVSKAEVETHQYNPTYMPASTPVRVAIVIAALVASVAGYRWWINPERHIHRLLSDVALQTLLEQPDHELHVARHDGELVGYFELGGDELAFFGLTLPYIGRRIGPWLLDRAIERAFARGITRIDLNTNTLDHPKALDTYRKAGFRPVRSESKELRDPRVLWPEVYRWPPK